MADLSHLSVDFHPVRKSYTQVTTWTAESRFFDRVGIMSVSSLHLYTTMQSQSALGV